ncbi:MAG: putative phage cell wall peptidase, NlpC/P60 family [Candidatus Accumulibacter regalis]|jgi:cell wall-associated NlpC family hydrolase|uniref:Phage cell wall peptidase, NlpC/P60 family n=1 Tax=Accumulibacter regalis TaxID=522306 RepID=A0A011PDC4_ACCRE|nr:MULTISPECIES: NlpC/P60 family protein [unclassified Candidatus Accumulibacter]EXI85591.1 MAG: putative phage cell wall peptidase, NlpC/P60 family [Candidatus Accumulibacter regalis]MBN8513542.1 C40 family peptidase [Accumulibacter sp.]MBO3701806.1 C40 family peptidase [Accumulibacter sp.]HRE72611.1 NlpC/P60 family protein [Accumulibacter sp.]
MSAERIVQEARSWLRTPYHHQGRIKGVGVDCAMILCEVYHAAGRVPYIDPTPYPPDWHLHRTEQRYLGWVEDYAYRVAEPLPGDIALYQFGRAISHAGIVVDWPMIIHAYHSEGVVLANATQGALAGRLAGFWRVRE